MTVHAAHNSVALPETFTDIVACLQEIGERWSNGTARSSDNIATRFTDRLQQAQSAMHGEGPAQNSLLDIRQPVYSNDLRLSRPGTRRGSAQLGAVPQQDFNLAAKTPTAGFSPDSMSLAFPPMPSLFEQYLGGPPMDVESNTQAFNIAQANSEYIMGSTATHPFDDIPNIFDSPFQEVRESQLRL